MKSATADRDEIARALGLLFRPGNVAELRAPGSAKGTISGYFDDFDALTAAAVRLSGAVPGVYVTLNPVNPVLLARAVNTVKSFAKATTSDVDILRRCWIPIDCDATRPSGISSTGREHEAALAVTRAVHAWLVTTIGIAPESLVLADSGNGGHVLVRVDLPNDDVSRMLVRQCLEAIGHTFDTDTVHIDTTVGNAARIMKLYGTVAAKGDHTPDRPHRVARLLEVPAVLVPTAPTLLTGLAARRPSDGPRHQAGASSTGGDFDVRRYLRDHGVTIKREKPWKDGGTVLELGACVFNPDHNRGEAAVILLATGMLLYRCPHASCSTKRWADVRAHLEQRGSHARQRAYDAPPPPEGEPGPDEAGEAGAEGGGGAACSSDEPWPQLLLLDLLDVPRYPVDALPAVLRDQVLDVSRVTQTPPDLAASSAVVVVAAVAARRVDVAIGRTHIEPLNLYGATIAESGTRKGPAQRAISKPLRALQAAMRAKAEPEIQRAQQRRQIAEKHIEELRKRAAKEKDDSERERLSAEAAQLATELPVVPPLPTLIVGDRTPEKLEVDLADQGGAVLIQDEEAGTLFAIAGGRYSRDGSAQLDVYCKANDRGALDTARITRAHVSVDTPELSIDVTPQPILMRKLRERPEFHERGLLPRFLFAVPKSNVGYRPYDPTAAFDVAAATNYANMIAQLATLTRYPDGAELPHLRIEGAALRVWKRYADRIDRDCREGGRLHAIREWASKHPGRVARIAGLLHLVDLASSKRLEVLRDLPSQNMVQLGLENLTDLATSSIPPRTVAAACRLGKYYEGHALAAYDCMAGLPDIEGARRVLAWIRRTKQMRFSARAAFTALDRHFFRIMDDLIPCLVRLVEYGYIRWVPPPPRSSVGRTPSPVYEVNPGVHDRLRTNRTTPPPAAASGSADTAEASSEFQARRENPKRDSADTAEDAGAFSQSGGGDPGDGSATSADTAEESGAAHPHATPPGVGSEKPGDAPQYPQNPGSNLQPPHTRDAGDRTDVEEGDAQRLEGNAPQAPQYPHNPSDRSRPEGSPGPSEEDGEDDVEVFE